MVAPPLLRRHFSACDAVGGDRVWPAKLDGDGDESSPSAAERVAQEDLVLFINACFACSGQSEFYGGSESQSVSIRFLHEYILGNYRRFYARTLAAGVNHFNQALIIQNLLAAGAPTEAVQRHEEGQLILAALLVCHRSACITCFPSYVRDG